MQPNWTVGMNAFVYDSTSNCILDGRIKTISGVTPGNRHVTLESHIGRETFSVSEQELYRCWEAANVVKYQDMNNRLKDVNDLDSFMNLVESIIDDATTEMSDKHYDVIKEAIKRLRKGD